MIKPTQPFNTTAFVVRSMELARKRRRARGFKHMVDQGFTPTQALDLLRLIDAKMNQDDLMGQR